MLFKNFIFIAFLAAFQCGNNSGYSLADSQSKNNVTGNNVSDEDFVSFLSNYNASDKINIINASRGGEFHLVYKKDIKDDFGINFPSGAKGEGWHWIRENADTGAINLKWYGAKGIGLSGYKDDSAAFVKAIDAIKAKGGGKLYIPASSSFYGFNGDGILLPDNTEIYGDGPNSAIKHINPESAAFYKGTIFYTTTYGPVDVMSIMREPMYQVQIAKKGDNYVVLKNISEAANLQKGKIIGLGAGAFVKGEGGITRFAQFEINEVDKVEGNKIYLKYSLSVPLRIFPKEQVVLGVKKTNNASVQDSTYPSIVDLSGKHTRSKKLNDYDRISRNIYIHDLKFSQADYNMLTNKPYNSTVPPGNVIGLGGTFESKFENLVLEGYGTFGGNLWNRCEISNLQIFSVKKLTDLGYGSANTKMHDITWTYLPTKIEAVNRSLVYLNDGTHDIEIYNVKATGEWSGNNLFQIAAGAHNINIHDVVINLPNLNNPKNSAIFIRDEGALTYSYNIEFKNVTVTLGSIKQFIQIEGTDEISDNKIISFDNVTFRGNVVSKNAITIANSLGIVLKKVHISEGNIVLHNSSAAQIENLDAPQSDIINTGNKGQKPQLIASKYKSLKNSQ